MATKYTSAHTGEKIDEAVGRAFLVGATEEEGFFYADAAGRVALKYNTDGLDAAKLSDHFQSLISGGGGDDYTDLGDMVYTVPQS